MLVIRPAQMQALEEHRLHEFRRRLSRDVEAAFAARGVRLSPESVDRQVNVAMRQAASLRLTRECDVARFAVMVCRFLGGFGEAPLPDVLTGILRSDQIDPDARMARAESWLQQTVNRKRRRRK